MSTKKKETRDETEPCCKGNPIQDYESKGKEILLGEDDNKMKVYVTEPSSSSSQQQASTKKIGIICSYDIFGFEMGGTRRVCDNMAETLGAVVVFGDYFREKPWDESNFPPKEEGGFDSFLAWAKSFSDEALLHDISVLKEYLKTEHKEVSKMGLLGFCFGGHPTFLAAKTGDYDAAVTCHGAFIEETEGEDVQCPLMMIDAGEDPDRSKIEESLKKKEAPLASKCQFHRYNDMVHGWVNRGDVNDAAVKKCMDEAFDLATTFFKDILAS